jgi:hypothetical protein
MNVVRLSAVTALGLGLAVAASNTFAQGHTDPAAIPTGPEPGSLQVRPGVADSAMEPRQGLAPAPSEDRTPGSITPSRWSGIHRPVESKPVE